MTHEPSDRPDKRAAPLLAARQHGAIRGRVRGGAVAGHPVGAAPGSAGTRSRLEKRFRRLVAAAGLPRARHNVVVLGFEVDFAWPRLVVEIDGPHHRRPRTRAEDEAQDAALRAAGYTVLRFSEEDVERRTTDVLRRLRAAIS